MRKPVVITSLEEDLQAIGLIRKEEVCVEDASPERSGALRRKRGQRPTTPSVERRASRLLEDVADVVDKVRPPAERERIKGFANVAVIASTLSERFAQMGATLDEDTLVEAGHLMEQLAEKAADRTLWLEKNRGPVPERKVKRTFESYMSDLLDALQLYSDITGVELEEMDDEDDDELDVEMKAPVTEFDDDEDELGEMDDEDDDEFEVEGLEVDEGVLRAQERLEAVRQRVAERRKSGKAQRPLSALRRRGRKS